MSTLVTYDLDSEKQPNTSAKDIAEDFKEFFNLEFFTHYPNSTLLCVEDLRESQCQRLANRLKSRWDAKKVLVGRFDRLVYET